MNRIKISENNESTRAPFWLIIEPKQNFKTNEDGIHNIASMITGVFFSRESAQTYLNAKSYNFSKNTRVFCHSGCYSKEWMDAINAPDKRIPDKNAILNLTEDEFREFDNKFSPNNHKTEKVFIKDGMIAVVFRRRNILGKYEEQEGAYIFQCDAIAWLAERFDFQRRKR